MNLKNTLIIVLLTTVNNCVYPQTEARNWNGKKCAVVLTYDDALNVHLDKVIPMLDSYKFRGTFYLIASSPVVSKRADEWRTASKKGHELGNHTLTHPCDARLPGREWVSPSNDLSNYTIPRAVKEIRMANAILKDIDGKDNRTFAYPCGDLTIHDTVYYNFVKNDFVAARGVQSGFLPIQEVNLSNVDCFDQNGTTAQQMIAQIEEAEKAGSFIVLLFHGVGGEHPLNVDLEEHKKLLEYLNKRENDIWIVPMVELTTYIKNKQAAKKT